MAYSDTINCVVGDTLPSLVCTIRDRNTAASGQTLRPNDPLTWAPMNLTGATVRMYIRAAGVATAPVATLTGTLTDAANGVVAFTFGSSTLSAAGTFDAEVEITFSGGGIQTIIHFIKIKVRDQIP